MIFAEKVRIGEKTVPFVLLLHGAPCSSVSIVVLGLLLCAMEIIPVFEHGLGIPKGR